MPRTGDAAAHPAGGPVNPHGQVPGVDFMHGVPVVLAERPADGVRGAVHHPGVVEVIDVHGQAQAVVGGRGVAAVVISARLA